MNWILWFIWFTGAAGLFGILGCLILPGGNQIIAAIEFGLALLFSVAATIVVIEHHRSFPPPNDP